MIGVAMAFCICNYICFVLFDANHFPMPFDWRMLTIPASLDIF